MEFSLQRDGYAILNLKGVNYIESIKSIISKHFPYNLPDLHAHQDVTQKQRCLWIKQAKDEVTKENLIYKLLRENLEIFTQLLGPDLDMQSNPHLRITRPNMDDAIGWHRDTFYGNLFWECNLWFPIFPLQKEAGLQVIQGSHLEPSKNIRVIEEDNPFRSSVIKGSLENELGYPYLPKTDDIISNKISDKARIQLLSPEVGQAIFFFGYLAHCPYNNSTQTRVSYDLRIKSMLAPTNTKGKYYSALSRGSIGNVVEQMMQLTS